MRAQRYFRNQWRAWFDRCLDEAAPASAIDALADLGIPAAACGRLR